MLYETIFYHLCKPLSKDPEQTLYVDILNESGKVVSRIKYTDVYIDGIEGIDFDYTKVQRDSGTFNVLFKFNNVDFDFIK